jgi:TP901 family phage tail tape measure protein
MADKEALLRLRLTAQNEANPAFESAAQAMRTLTEPAQNASKAFSEAASGLRGFEDALKTATATIGEAGRSFDSVKQASSELGQAVKDDGTTFREMAQSLTSIDNSLKEVSQSMRGVEEASQAFNRAENNAKGLNETVSKGGLLLGLQQLGQSMEEIGQKGDEMFKSAIESAAEFEANISRIHAVLMNREPTANMEAMKEAALRLGANSKFSANEIAQGMYDLARQGLSSTQILGDGVNGAIEIVNNLAQSTDTDMSETAKIIADVMHEFNLSGEQLGKVGDMISGTMHTSSISMNDFYYAMRQVGPVASNMHQSIEDVSTTIALLAQHGIAGSSAGTALKNMLLGLEPRTEKAAALMKDLGISAKNGAADSFYQLNGNLKPLPEIIGILHDKFGGLNDKQKEAALAATFTKYGLAGLNTVVMEGKDKFEELKKTLMEEKAADIAREKMNNLQGDMWRLHAAIGTMSKSFGDTLEPSMRKVAQAAQGIINWFTNLSPATKEVIMIVGGVASAMVTVGGAILGVVSAIGFLNMGLAGTKMTLSGILAPTGLVTAAVALLAVGAYELYQHWDQVKAGLQAVGNAIITFKNEAIAVLSDELTRHKGVIEGVATALTVIFGPALIKTGVEAAIAGTKLAVEFAVAITKAGIEATVAGAKLAADFIVQVIKMGVEVSLTAAKITGEMIVALITYAAKGWDAAIMIGGQTTALIANAAAFVAQKVALVASEVATAALTAAQWALNVALNANPIGIVILAIAALGAAIYEVIKHWQDIVTWIKNAWQELINFKDQALNFGSDFVKNVADGISGAIHFVVESASKVVNAIKSIFSSAPPPPQYSAPAGPPAPEAMAESVPHFAQGGVVTKPTLALVGEGGEREFIVPESKLRNQDGYTLGLNVPFNNGAIRGNGASIVFNATFNINGTNKDGRQIGNDIMTILRREFKFAL